MPKTREMADGFVVGEMGVKGIRVPAWVKVKGWRVGDNAARASDEVLPAMTTADASGRREMVVPSNVIVEPGRRVWLPMTNSLEGLAVMVVEPMVRMGGLEGCRVATAGGGGRGIVDVWSIMTCVPWGSRDI